MWASSGSGPGDKKWAVFDTTNKVIPVLKSSAPGVSVECILLCLDGDVLSSCQSKVETKAISGVVIAGLSFAREI